MSKLNALKKSGAPDVLLRKNVSLYRDKLTFDLSSNNNVPVNENTKHLLMKLIILVWL